VFNWRHVTLITPPLE